MANIEYKRLVQKSGNGKATIPPSPSHDTGDWIATDIYEQELYVDETTKKLYTRVGSTIIQINEKPSFPPAIDFVGCVGSNPPTEVDGDVYVIEKETVATYMNVDNIAWQAISDRVRYTFSEFSMMTEGAVAVGDYFHPQDASIVVHNGTFAIVAFNIPGGWIEIVNPLVTDAGNDEVSDSSAIGYFTKAAWDGGKFNSVMEFQSGDSRWHEIIPVAGQTIINKADYTQYVFNGTTWVTVVVPSATETVKGVAEIATQAETDAGMDNERIVTPIKLTTWWTSIKTIAASITGIWAFAYGKLRVVASGASWYTEINTSASSNQTWIIPAEGDQTFASRTYVDNLSAGLKWKTQVVAATTAAGTLTTDFENGDTLDGVLLATGDRILIKNQAAGIENGIYVVQAAGAPVRASDADSGTELISSAIFVQMGTVNADRAFVCTNDTITLGVTSIVFTGFASVIGALLAANNLSDVASASTALTNIGGEALSNKDIDGTFTANSDIKYPSQKAAKTYVDGKITDAITNGVTTKAPAQNAVFDALAIHESEWKTIAHGFANLGNPIVAAADIYWHSHMSNQNTRQNIDGALGPGFVYLKATDYVSAIGLTPKLRIKIALMSVNDVGPGQTITPGLYPCAGPTSGATGIATQRKFAAGTVVTGSNGISFVSPAADAFVVDQYSAVFNFPAEGLYSIASLTSGAFTASSAVHIIAELQLHFE